MLQVQSRLFPYRSYDANDVIDLYAHINTGLGGEFVSLLTGAADPTNEDGYSNTSVGATYPLVTSLRYQNNWRVQPATGGSLRAQILGVTLSTTAEYDENGNKLVYNPQHAKELGYVVSGQSVPILTRGILVLRSDAYSGTPLPGQLGTIAGNGILQVTDPGAVGGTGQPPLESIVGKFISTTGAVNTLGYSYAYFKVEL